jgi:phytoene dehydrogenase-like protein
MTFGIRLDYDVVIVGGGHNGLVCAAYLARAGARALVLERRHLLGGAAVTEEPWPGYRVSTASYVVSLMQPDIVRYLQLPRFGYHVYPLNPAEFVPYPDGRYLLFWEDPARRAAEIAKFSHRDAEAYVEYDRALTDLVGIVKPLLDRVPPSPRLASFADLRAATGLGTHLLRHRRHVARLVDLMTLSVSDFLDDWFDSEPVKGALAYGGTIGAWAGPRSPGTAYVLLHHRMGEGASGARGGWGFVRGGMGALSNAVADSARAAGAVIWCDAEVARIDVEGGRATGVTLTDGTTVRGGFVASSAHPRTTFLDLVGPDRLPPDLVREMERYRTRSGSVKLNLALAELPDFTCLPGTEPGPQHPEFVISPSVDYLERAWEDAKHGRPSAEPMVDSVIPTTKDPTLAPPRRHVMTCFVQYAPYRLAEGVPWDAAARDAFADRILAMLGRYAPNLPGAVLHRELLTPVDIEARFGLLGGNIFHGEMSLDQLLSFRPAPDAASYRTPVPGLYLCGSGTHPGGGVMGAPGRNAARVMAWELRRAGRRRPVTMARGRGTVRVG